MTLNVHNQLLPIIMPIQLLLTVTLITLMNLCHLKLQMTIQNDSVTVNHTNQNHSAPFRHTSQNVQVVLPKQNQTVKCRHRQNQWETVTVLERYGYRKGKYRNWLNVHDTEQYSIDWGDIDEWHLLEHAQDPKNTEQCEITENETDPLSNCDPLPKNFTGSESM